MPIARDEQGNEVELINGQWVPREKPSAVDSFLRGGDQFASGVFRGMLETPTAIIDSMTQNPLTPFGAPTAIRNLIERSIGAEETPTPNLTNIMREGLTDVVGLPEPETPLDQGLQRAGFSLGATVLPTGAMVRGAGLPGAIRNPASLFSQTLGGIAQNPARFAAGDLGLATAGGAGAATAQHLAPGSPTAEMLGEIAPVLGLTGAAALTRGTLRGFTPAARDAANPGSFAGRVAAAGAADAPLSVGQAVPEGRRAITAIENLMAKIPGGVTPFSRARIHQQGALGRSVARVARRLSKKGGQFDGGVALQVGVDDFADGFRARQGQLYDDLDQFIAPDSAVRIDNFRSTIDDIATPLEGAEPLSNILQSPKLRALKTATDETLAAGGGTMPYRALKQMRSLIGDMLGNPKSVLDDAPIGQLKRLYGSLSDDMRNAVTDAGGQPAINAWKRADGFTRAGHARADGLRRLARDVEPEKIFKAFEASLRDGPTLARRTLRSLKPTERDIVVSSVVRRMGRPPAHQAGVDISEIDDVFSSETFLTNWNKFNREGGLDALFSFNRGYQRDLQKVANVAQMVREGSAVMRNPPNTASALINQSAPFVIAGAFGLDAGLAAVGIPTSIGTNMSIPIAANAGASRLMASPRFVRWLAQATRAPLKNIPGMLVRLQKIEETATPDLVDSIRSYRISTEQLIQQGQRRAPQAGR